METIKLGLPVAPIVKFGDELCLKSNLGNVPNLRDRDVLGMLVKYNRTLEHFSVRKTQPWTLPPELIELAKKVESWKLVSLKLIFSKKSNNIMTIPLLILPKVTETLRSLTMDCTYSLDEELVCWILQCKRLEEFYVQHLHYNDVLEDYICSFLEFFEHPTPERANDSVTTLSLNCASIDETHDLGLLSEDQVLKLPRFFSAVKRLSFAVHTLHVGYFDAVSRAYPGLQSLSIFSFIPPEESVDLSRLTQLTSLEEVCFKNYEDNSSLRFRSSDQVPRFQRAHFKNCVLENPSEWGISSLVCRACEFPQSIWQGGPDYPNLNCLTSLHLGPARCVFRGTSLIVRDLPSLTYLKIVCSGDDQAGFKISGNDALEVVQLMFTSTLRHSFSCLELSGLAMKEVRLCCFRDIQELKVHLPQCEDFRLRGPDVIKQNLLHRLRSMIPQLSWATDEDEFVGASRARSSAKVGGKRKR
eukprot:TRINITY_DN4269_c0_g2_i1.p1 TRINITY_DN4269_c0_g2~~TRINITY_DN4269_c0_g2_i1.p1  ORF type:complete len:533 (-),score=89.37 TRINITY_DN4269_c0_g2_i1:1035-2447(-)